MFALCFSKLNLALVTLREGEEKGVGGFSNRCGKGRGVGRGGQASGSLSSDLRVFHICTILTLYFFRISFDSPHGQRIVAAGLYIAQERRSKGKF